MVIKDKLLKLFLIIILIFLFSSAFIFSQMSDNEIKQLLIGTWKYAFDQEGVFTSSTVGFDTASNNTSYAIVDNNTIAFELEYKEGDITKKNIIGPFITSYSIKGSKLYFTYRASLEDTNIYNGVFELVFESDDKFVGIFIATDEIERKTSINIFKMYCVKQQ